LPAHLSAHTSLSIPALGAFQLRLTPFNSTPTFARLQDDRLAAIVAARVGLRRVYVKDAEAESEISAALVKWAYTTCRRAEEIVAERCDGQSP
jgi:hypothetical protein